MGWLMRLLGLESQGPQVIVTYGQELAPRPKQPRDCPSQWPPSATRTLCLNDRYRDFSVIRESQHKETIELLYRRLGGLPDYGSVSTVFYLEREGSDVRVIATDRATVGYFSKSDGAAYGEVFDRVSGRFDVVWCQGYIEKQSGRRVFSVTLDLATATECLDRIASGRNDAGVNREKGVTWG